MLTNLSTRTQRSTRAQRLICMALVIAALITSGCVRRRLTIRSNPPGALVYVDDYEIGTTPCSTSFTYYGTRQIRLVKDGYETLTVYEPIKAPSYQIPPLDFISETMTTSEMRDERTLSYQLSPQVVVPGEILKVRAEQLRLDARTPDAALAGGLLGPMNSLNAAPQGILPAPAMPIQEYPVIPQTPPPGSLPPGTPVPETLPPGGQPPHFTSPLQQQ